MFYFCLFVCFNMYFMHLYPTSIYDIYLTGALCYINANLLWHFGKVMAKEEQGNFCLHCSVSNDCPIYCSVNRTETFWKIFLTFVNVNHTNWQWDSALDRAACHVGWVSLRTNFELWELILSHIHYTDTIYLL